MFCAGPAWVTDGHGPDSPAVRGWWELTAEQVWYPEPKSKRHCSSIE